MKGRLGQGEGDQISCSRRLLAQRPKQLSVSMRFHLVLLQSVRIGLKVLQILLMSDAWMKAFAEACGDLRT